MKTRYCWLFVVVLVIVYTSAPTTQGETIVFTANLQGSSEVPPVATAAFGYAQFILSLNTLQADYTLSIRNLPSYTGSHIHLAGPGGVGNVIIPFTAIPAGFAGDGEFRGRFDLDRDLIAFPDRGLVNGRDLEQIFRLNNAANLYVNVHSRQFPGGEIRGQLILKP